MFNGVRKFLSKLCPALCSSCWPEQLNNDAGERTDATTHMGIAGVRRPLSLGAAGLGFEARTGDADQSAFEHVQALVELIVGDHERDE